MKRKMMSRNKQQMRQQCRNRRNGKERSCHPASRLRKFLLFLIPAAAVLVWAESVLPPVIHKRRNRQRTFEYGLLLGCSPYKDGTPSNSMKGRCNLAIELFKQHRYKTLIISGGAVKTPYIESEVMKDYIHQRCPDLPVITETKARNTWQNMEFARTISEGQPILVITGQLHERRASAMARNFFSDFDTASYPDFKWKRALREVISRAVFYRLELKKQIQSILDMFRTHSKKTD